MIKSVRQFIDKLLEHQNKENKKPYFERDICPMTTDAQLVVECLCDIFLGEDWYVTFPLHTTQVNTCILDEILYNYCKEYRKYCKTTNKKYRYKINLMTGDLY